MVGMIAALSTSGSSGGSTLPGRVGVYANLHAEAASPDTLRQAMREIKGAGIEFILATAKATSGKVNWDSSVAPPELVADRDYIKRVIEAAHAEGLKVYPVVCVVPEGGDTAPNALLKSHPDWGYFYNGAWRGYIDPGNADARRYEVSLMVELVSKYDVDGLSLDYLRCPNGVGYTKSGQAEFLKEHKVDLAEVVGTVTEALDTEGGKKALSAAAASARANPIWPEWRLWRQDKINLLMQELAAAVHKAKPGLPISSYVWGAHTYTGSSEICQDWVTWIKKRWIDWINPSGYRYTDEAFLEAAKGNRAAVPKGFPFYITIGVKTSHGELHSAEEVKHQIAMSRENGADGIIFFTWAPLRPFIPQVVESIKGYR